MSDDEYDIHPLDRDYSVPSKPRAKSQFGDKSKREYSPEMRRFGAIFFTCGFIVLMVTIIVLANVRGGEIESIASFFNRTASLAMLFGGVVIVLAYRMPGLGDAWSGVDLSRDDNEEPNPRPGRSKRSLENLD